MKHAVKVAVIALALSIFSGGAFAWNCPTGQIRQQAPVGTPSSTPYYDVVEGIAFICVPSTTPTSGNQNQTQSQNQSQSNSQNSTQNTSNQNVSSSGSTSKSISGVSNSGNSSNSNTNTNTLSPVLTSSATGGTATATGGNQSQTASSANNSSGNVTSYSDTYNEVRQNPGAFAPTAFSTSPCTKGVSGGGSTPTVAATFGLALTDKGCDSRQTAAVFYAIGNPAAAARILCSTDASKRAHLTIDQCLSIVAPVPFVPPTPAPSKPEIVVVPVPTPVAAVPETRVVEVPKETVTSLYDVGSCVMTGLRLTNSCKRILDDVALRLENKPDAKLVLTGPVESVSAVAYLSNRVSRSRVVVHIADDQNATLNMQLEGL